jgi:hypothetical protein
MAKHQGQICERAYHLCFPIHGSGEDPGMEVIVKVISMFIALFVIVNGIWVAYMPPFGDEPVGYAIIAVGIFIPIITFNIAKLSSPGND